MEEKEAIKTALMLGSGGFILASVFGLIRWAQDFTNASRPDFVWWVGVIKGGTAGVCGFLATFLCLEFKVDLWMGIILVAVSGWGGVETLNVLKDASLEVLRKWLSGGK